MSIKKFNFFLLVVSTVVIIVLSGFLVYKKTNLQHSDVPLQDESLKEAIIVGINEYNQQNGLESLKYAVSDAKLIGDAFSNLGYSTRLFLDQQAVKSRILDAIKQAGEKVGESGTLIFFFAGHGLGHKDGNNYLVTQDGLLHNLEETALSTTELRNALKAAGVKRAALFLDACRDKATLNVPRSIFNTSFLYEENEGFYTLYSTEFGDKSYEIDKLKHGVFSYILNKGLRGEAARGGEIISFINLARYVQNGVPNWLKNNIYPRKEQLPHFTIFESFGILNLGKYRGDTQESPRANGRSISERGQNSDLATTTKSQIELEHERLNRFWESKTTK